MFPDFPALKDFLTFRETALDGPPFAVTVAHSKLPFAAGANRASRLSGEQSKRA